MAKLSDEEQATLDKLTEKANAPEENNSSHSRVENINITIDLDNEAQVKRAVKSGLLPASYLEDDVEEETEEEEENESSEPPRRRSRYN